MDHVRKTGIGMGDQRVSGQRPTCDDATSGSPEHTSPLVAKLRLLGPQFLRFSRRDV